ncbi:hypothetical protein Sango_1845200 [Sesamum angolense]|uniref:Small auxin up regulated protein n=1 Tax=Sesamum angolense TaxID=2727404 RepID=A0AAE1WHV9_9LAMI|nr:hypothetical protein Sango_1845200 [Sesamum angolense]
MQERRNKTKVKKGRVTVNVGLTHDNDNDNDDENRDHRAFQRFVIPISYLHHPDFRMLLDRAREIYGYQTTGPLMLPCSIDDFLRIQRKIEKGGKKYGSWKQQ